jgi:hypothetical protein
LHNPTRYPLLIWINRTSVAEQISYEHVNALSGNLLQTKLQSENYYVHGVFYARFVDTWRLSAQPRVEKIEKDAPYNASGDRYR